MKHEALIERAREIYGECLGSSHCFEYVVRILVDDYKISREYAEDLAQQVFDQWVEAYGK